LNIAEWSTEEQKGAQAERPIEAIMKEISMPHLHRKGYRLIILQQECPLKCRREIIYARDLKRSCQGLRRARRRLIATWEWI
jgi:hypothetical protein